jgi:hypothetical protein
MWPEAPCSQSVDWHGHAGWLRFREITGMKFDWQLVSADQFHPVRQTPITEAEPGLRLGIIASRSVPKHRLNRTLSLGISPLFHRFVVL